MAKLAGASLVLNEIDPFRAGLLEAVFRIRPERHDAEHVDDLLDRSHAADVVLMNPPFSSSASRAGDPTIALRHAISAAKRLSPADASSRSSREPPATSGNPRSGGG